MSALGGSPAARIVRDDLVTHGVEVVDLVSDPTEGVGVGEPHQLPVSTALIDPDGERTVVATDASTTDIPLTDEARAIVAAAHVLLLDGHHPVAADEALTIASGRDGAVTVLDAGSVKPHAEQWISRLDILAGSADYADGLGLDLEAALDHAIEAGAGAAIMTDGGDPGCWRRSAHARLAPTRPGEALHGVLTPQRVTALDTLAAGDTFHGALVAGLVLHERALAPALELATDVATLRVQHAGARAWLRHLSTLPALAAPPTLAAPEPDVRPSCPAPTETRPGWSADG